MPDHLIFPLEAFAPFTPGAAFDTTVVGSIRGMDIRVRI
jgi:hypothetical protein